VSDPLAELPELIAALVEEAAKAEDDTAAFLFVRRLNTALQGFPDLMDAAGRVQEMASLGPSRAAERLTEVRAELTARQAELAAAQEVAEQLRPALDELAAVRAEHERITADLAELERLEELHASLEPLREQRRALTGQATAFEDAATEEAALAAAARTLSESAQVRLDGLEESVSRAMVRAQDLAGEVARAGERLADERERVAGLDAELGSLDEEFTDLSAERETRLRHIEAYQRADRALCEALAASPLAEGTGLARVQSSLDEVETRLATIDAALREALAVHDERHTDVRRPRGLVP
jgi:chromosome segregation ATPase